MITPLMDVRGTVTYGLSTLNDKEGYYSRLFELKDPVTRKPIFSRVSIALDCKHCKREGRGRYEKCPHPKRNIEPRWKNEQRMAKAMLSEEDQDRESMGLATSRMRPAFDVRLLDAFRAKRPYTLESVVDVVFITIDPSGGSASLSDLAMMAGAFNSKGDIVVSCFFYLFSFSFFMLV